MEEPQDVLDSTLPHEDVSRPHTTVDLSSWLKQLPALTPGAPPREEHPSASKDSEGATFSNGHASSSSCVPSTYSSLRSQKSSRGDTLNSRGKRRVKIVLDINADKDSSTFYRIRSDAVTSVPYNTITWDSMVQNLRIALQMNSLFLVDGFLGDKMAQGLYSQLLQLRDSGFFDLHMRSCSSGEQHQYACACLTQPESEHSLIDSLVLIFYKLAQYYTKDWKGVKVNVLYFPDGMESRKYKAINSDPDLTLTCLYFCTKGLQLVENEGALAIKTTGHRDVKAENRFDRLVAFWETAEDSATLNYITSEVFLINLVLKL